jgi:exosome complex exonuclease DIS3/RRP44
MSVINKRHRLSQMASRASVEFYVGLALKGRGYTAEKGSREEAFVIRTFRNGLAVFVSRYDLLLMGRNMADVQTGSGGIDYIQEGHA